MTTPEVISTIKDIFVALAAIVASGVAFAGLSKWRSELRGRTEFDIAFNLAKATYKLREEIENCRSRLVNGSEYPPGQTAAPKADDKKTWVYILNNRLKTVIEAVREFDAHSLAAEALWGSDMRSRTEALRKCVGSLSLAMRAFIDSQSLRPEDFGADKDYMIGIRQTLFSSEGGKLDQEIERAIQGIEEQIRRHLRRN